MKKLKITAVISGILTLIQVLPPLVSAIWSLLFAMGSIRVASSIGIIGGADGPTAIYMVPSFMIIARQVFFAACLFTFIVSMSLIIKNRNKGKG